MKIGRLLTELFEE